MDLAELKKEQLKLAPKVVLKDGFSTLSSIKTIGGIDSIGIGTELLACAVVCEFPSMKLLESKTYLLHQPLPYVPGFQAYREMPAMIEAFNHLETEPDLLLVSGAGIAHPRRLGIASHLGLVLNKPTIGVTQKLLFGKVERGKIVAAVDILGFEIKTREHSNPVYVSPGHLIALGTVLSIMPKLMREPHKMPEPLHLAHKLARREGKRVNKTTLVGEGSA